MEVQRYTDARKQRLTRPSRVFRNFIVPISCRKVMHKALFGSELFSGVIYRRIGISRR